MANGNEFDALKEWGADVDLAMSRMMNNPDFYRRMLSIFIKDTSAEKLFQAVEDKNYKDGFFLAHTLKGTTGNLALTPLFDLFHTITEKLRNEDNYQDVTEEIRQAKEKYTSLLGILEGIGIKRE